MKLEILTLKDMAIIPATLVWEFSPNTLPPLSPPLHPWLVEGDKGGWIPGEKGGGKCMGGRRRGGGKQDSQGGGKWEKWRKIMQHYAVFAIKNAQRWEPTK